MRPLLSDSEISAFPRSGLCRRDGSKSRPSPEDDPVIGDPKAPVGFLLI